MLPKTPFVLKIMHFKIHITLSFMKPEQFKYKSNPALEYCPEKP